jgi:hypothetical protein
LNAFASRAAGSSARSDAFASNMASSVVSV